MRRTVRERFGVDPVEGFEPPRLGPRPGPGDQEAIRQARLRLLWSLNDRIRPPVILFDPSVPIVWQIKKPWEPPDRSGAPALAAPRGWVHPPVGGGRAP
jgi:hypothetical protein